MKFVLTLLLFALFTAWPAHGQRLCQFPVTDENGNLRYVTAPCSSAGGGSGLCSFPVTDPGGNLRYVTGPCSQAGGGTTCSFPVTDPNGNLIYVTGPCSSGGGRGLCSFPVTDENGNLTYVTGPCSAGGGQTQCTFPVTDENGNLTYITGPCSSAGGQGQCSFPVTDDNGNLTYVTGPCSGGGGQTQCSFPVTDENGNLTYITGPCASGTSTAQCSFPITDPGGNLVYVRGPCSQGQSTPQCSFPITDANGNLTYVQGPCAQGSSTPQCSFPITDASGNLTYVQGPCAQGSSTPQCSFPITDASGNLTYVQGPCSQTVTGPGLCSFPITDQNGNLTYVQAPCSQPPGTISGSGLPNNPTPECSFPITDATGNVSFVRAPCSNPPAANPDSSVAVNQANCTFPLTDQNGMVTLVTAPCNAPPGPPVNDSSAVSPMCSFPSTDENGSISFVSAPCAGGQAEGANANSNSKKQKKKKKKGDSRAKKQNQAGRIQKMDAPQPLPIAYFKRAEAADGPPAAAQEEPTRILPYLNCVYRLGENNYIAYFGYENTSDKSVGAGESSAVQSVVRPKALKLSKAIEFLPGRHDGAFSVVFDGRPIEWRISGPGIRPASASAKKESAACEPVRPVAECKKEDGSLVFGYRNDNPFTVNIPVGDFNSFLGAQTDKGQPSEFFSGRVSNVFSASADAGWQLSGRDSGLTEKTCGAARDSEAAALSCSVTETGPLIDNIKQTNSDLLSLLEIRGDKTRIKRAHALLKQAENSFQSWPAEISNCAEEPRCDLRDQNGTQRRSGYYTKRIFAELRAALRVHRKENSQAREELLLARRLYLQSREILRQAPRFRSLCR